MTCLAALESSASIPRILCLPSANMEFTSIGREEWISLNPLHILHTFKLQIEKGSWRRAEEAKSTLSGLGWQFSVSSVPPWNRCNISMSNEPPAGEGGSSIRASRMKVVCQVLWRGDETRPHRRIAGTSFEIELAERTESSLLLFDTSQSPSLYILVFDVYFSPWPFICGLDSQITKASVQSTEDLVLDLKFYLFSSRASKGLICRPKALRSSRAFLGDRLSDCK